MRVEAIAGGHGGDEVKNGIMNGQNGNRMFAFTGPD